MIFQNSLKAKLLSYPGFAPFAEEYSQNAVDLVQVIKTMRDGSNKTDIKQAYSDALRVVWAAMCAVAAVGLVVSFFTVEYTLDSPKNVEKDPQRGRNAAEGMEKNSKDSRGGGEEMETNPAVPGEISSMNRTEG